MNTSRSMLERAQRSRLLAYGATGLTLSITGRGTGTALPGDPPASAIMQQALWMLTAYTVAICALLMAVGLLTCVLERHAAHRTPCGPCRSERDRPSTGHRPHTATRASLRTAHPCATAWLRPAPSPQSGNATR